LEDSWNEGKTEDRRSENGRRILMEKDILDMMITPKIAFLCLLFPFYLEHGMASGVFPLCFKWEFGVSLMMIKTVVERRMVDGR